MCLSRWDALDGLKRVRANRHPCDLRTLLSSSMTQLIGRDSSANFLELGIRDRTQGSDCS